MKDKEDQCNNDPHSSTAEDIPSTITNNTVPSQESDNWLQKNSQILFSFGCVKVYFISPDGTVETTGTEDTLNIFKLTEPVAVENIELPNIFLQIGNWYYPLVPNVSPYFKDENDAFIFPDINSTVSGSSVAVVFPSETVTCFDTVLQYILSGTSDKEEEEEEGAKPRSRRSAEYSQPIARGMVAGATFISQGLISTAEQASKVMSQMTPHIMNKLSPEHTPWQVNPALSKSMEISKRITYSAASLTGFMATQVGHATSALGTFLAPYVHKQGIRLLSSAGMSPDSASQSMTGALQVAAGAVESVSTIYTGLEQFSCVLAKSLSNNTVQVVNYKYGPHAGNVAENTLSSVGSLLQAASNLKVLTPKGAFKKTFKDTGKAVINAEYQY